MKTNKNRFRQGFFIYENAKSLIETINEHGNTVNYHNKFNGTLNDAIKEAKRRLVFLFNRCEVYEKILDNYKHYLTPEKFQKLNEREGFDFLINFLNSYNLLCQSLAKVSSLYTGKDLTEYEIEVLEMMKLLNFEEKQLVVDVVREIKNLKWIDRRNYILKKARFIKEQRRKQRRK